MICLYHDVQINGKLTVTDENRAFAKQQIDSIMGEVLELFPPPTMEQCATDSQHGQLFGVIFRRHGMRQLYSEFVPEWAASFVPLIVMSQVLWMFSRFGKIHNLPNMIRCEQLYPETALREWINMEGSHTDDFLLMPKDAQTYSDMIARGRLLLEAKGFQLDAPIQPYS